MLVISIRATDKISVAKIDGDSLHALQKMVGGFIEIVRPRYLRKPYVMIVNEEGLLHDLPVNNTGTLLYGSNLTPILGDIVIMQEGFTDEGEPDLMGLEPAEASSLLAELLHRFAFLDLVE